MIQWLNDLRDAIKARTPLNSADIKLDERTDGFHMKQAVKSTGGGSNNQVPVWG